MKHFVIGLLVCGSLIGCGKKEDSTDSVEGINPGAGPLPLSALEKPSGLRLYDAAEARSAIEDGSFDFLATYEDVPEDTASEDPDGEIDCASAAFDKVRYSVVGDTMTVDVIIDMTSCLKTAWANAGEGLTGDVSKAVMSFYLQTTCVGGDLSSYEGKSLNESGDDIQCDTMKVHMNMSSETEATLSGGGETLTFHTLSTSVFGTDANEPCTVTRSDNVWTRNGCVEIIKTVQPDGTDQNEFTRRSFNAMTWVDSTKDTWYTSGALGLDMNNWTGTITFRGADVDPLYELSSGSETINGTLSLPTGLHLKNSVERALVRGMPRLKKMH